MPMVTTVIGVRGGRGGSCIYALPTAGRFVMVWCISCNMFRSSGRRSRKLPRAGSFVRASNAKLPRANRCQRNRRQFEKKSPALLIHAGYGCRALLVYCGLGRCHHSATMNADWLPDEMPVRSLCRRMVCTRCGMIGADVRPDWAPHVNRRHV
jgi:hypothetical protein